MFFHDFFIISVTQLCVWSLIITKIQIITSTTKKMPAFCK